MNPLEIHWAILRWRERRFDRINGVMTREQPAPSGGVSDAAKLRWPSDLGLFGRIVRRSRARPQDYAFVDLGSGKGRALLVASTRGFRRIVGVEHDSDLCRIAADNAGKWHRRHRRGPAIEVVNGDAAEVGLPDGNLFVYMYNPFTGAVFERVAQRLAALAGEEGRAVVVAYNRATCGDVLEATGAFTRVDMRPLRFWAPRTVSFFYNPAAWAQRRR